MKRVIIIGFICIVGLIGTCIGVGIVTATQNENQEESITMQMDQNIEKYFELEEDQVLLQQKIVVNANRKDVKKENERLSIKVPMIQGQKPKTVNVLADGKLVADEFCHYDTQKNQLNVENKDNVSVYKVIYEYQGIHAEQEEIQLDTKVDTKYENRGEVKTQDERSMDITPMGEKVSVQGEITRKVYKGYLYEAKENRTSYEENYMIEVSSIQNVEEINLSREKEVFTYEIGEGEEKTKIENSTKDHVHLIKTRINKEQILSILGEEGKITIQNEQDEILEELTKDSQADENGDIVVNFEDKEVKNIKISTTRPVQLGEIKIYNHKAIDGNIEYEKEEIEKFQNLESSIKVNEARNELKMNLMNTRSEATIHMDKVDLSTLQKNENVQIMLTLQSNSNQYDLYKNPVIDLVFPKELEIDIKNVTQLNFEDIMQVKNVEIQQDNEGRKIVRVILEGEQDSYSSQSKEAIQINMTADISIANTTPSQESTIEVYCRNENVGGEEVKTECPFKMNSRYGMLIVNKVENYNPVKDTIQAVDEREIIAQLDSLAEKREAKQTLEIINNYENPVSEFCMIGTLKEEESMNLGLQPIAVSTDKNAKIYYAEKEAIEENNIEWKENIEEVEKIKSYKVVIEDEIQPGESVGIVNELNIPENLDAGKNNYVKNMLTYNCLDHIEETTSSIKFTTGNKQLETFQAEKTAKEGQGIKVEISAITGEQSLKEGDTVKEGQGIRYKVRLTNESEADLKNLVLEATNANAIYYELIEYDADVDGTMMKKSKIEENEKLTAKTLKIDSLAIGETKEVSYQISVKKVEDNNQKLTGQIKITADECEEMVIPNITNTIQKGKIKPTLRFLYSEDEITDTKSSIPLELKVENISEEELKEIMVEFPIPNGVKFNPDYITIENKVAKFIEYVDGKAKFKISEIKAKEAVSVSVKLIVEQMNISKVEQIISQYFKVIDGEEQYISNDVQRNVKQDETKIVVNQTTNKTKEIVQDGDNIKFFIHIENQGFIEKEIAITDQIPSGLKINSAKMTTSKEEKQLEPINNLVIANVTIQPKEIIELEIDTTVDKETAYDNKITNEVMVSGFSVDETSNLISFKIQIEYEEDKEDDPSIQQPSDNPDPSNPEEPENPNDDNNQSNNQNQVYSISGVAWIDKNSNGEKDANEDKISNMPVYLVDEQTGNSISSKTKGDGSYQFGNLKQGKYIVAFQYNENTYTLTTYQKEGVNQEKDSDVIYSKMKIGNREVTVAKTKTLELQERDLQNIDAGFVEGKTFDLKIDKTVNRVTIASKSGTNVRSYAQEKLVKVEIDAKQLESSNVVIEYNIAVTNQGDIEGYASEIVDKIPQELLFSSELNKSWYQMENGSIGTKELSNQIIRPGETKNINLILTKKMTKSNTGTVMNRATISKYNNDYMVEDKNLNNNESQAEVIISVRTGRIILYISLILIIIIMIGMGIYLIQKKVLIERR